MLVLDDTGNALRTAPEVMLALRDLTLRERRQEVISGALKPLVKSPRVTTRGKHSGDPLKFSAGTSRTFRTAEHAAPPSFSHVLRLAF